MSTNEILLNQNNDQYIRKSSVQTFIQEIEEKVEDWINKNILGVSKPQFTIKGLLPLVEKDVWLVNILFYYQKQELGFIIEAYINDSTKELSISHSIENICNKLVKVLSQERNSILQTSIDRSKELDWLKKNKKEYADLWVALDGDKLIASGANHKEVFQIARSKGISRPLIVKVEAEDNAAYVGW